MTRQARIALAGCAAIAAALAYRPVTKRLDVWRYDGDGVGSFRAYEPLPEQIEKTMGRASGGNRDEDLDRTRQFTSLYKRRFRSNFQAVSIVREPGGRLRMQFAAVIPRWDMAHVALDATELAHRVLGRRYEMDLYETYIPTIRKIGELRWRDEGRRAEVIFDDMFAVRMRPLGPDAPVRLGPFSQIPFRAPRGPMRLPQAPPTSARSFLERTDLSFEQE